MIRIHLPLILYQFFWLISSTYSAYKPLIFHPYTLEIYDYGDTSITYKSGPYVAACPATNEREKNFNKVFSLNDKSLFVRHYSIEGDDKGFIYKIRCKSSVELAVAYYIDPNTKLKYLKFGYEVYFIESRNPEDFNNVSSYSNFERVLKPAMKRITDFIFGSYAKTQILEMEHEGAPITLRMGFMWVSKSTLQPIKSKWRVQSVAYSIHKKADWPATKCDDYELHEELYPKWSLNDLYSEKNQKKIFSSIKLLEEDCKLKTYCVQKYSLVPAYQLQLNASKPVSCTKLATVPIWSKTAAQLLDYLDKFLFTVAQFADRKLQIYPEVFDTLVLPTGNGIKQKKHMYLDPWKKKLAIPKIIIKLVIYQTHTCDTSKILCWFQVIIVIHNEPTVTKKLCYEDKCEQLGWASIQYQNKNNPREKSEHIYCCEINDTLKEILMGSTEKTFVHENLDLKRFPRYNKTTHEFDYEDKQKLIEDKMNQWIEGEESADPPNSWPSLPPSQDVQYLYL